MEQLTDEDLKRRVFINLRTSFKAFCLLISIVFVGLLMDFFQPGLLVFPGRPLLLIVFIILLVVASGNRLLLLIVRHPSSHVVRTGPNTFYIEI